MSLSIELKVNGQPVATLVAHRDRGMPGQMCEYSGQATLFQMHGEPKSFMFTGVQHHYDDGIVKLAKKLLTEWAKKA